MRLLLAKSLTAGIIMATSGVLFMNALRPMFGRTTRQIAPRSDLGRPNIVRAIAATAPVS
jgi:hypothetical protein